MATITVHTPNPVATPRGAEMVATVMARVLNWLEEVGRARAAESLRRLENTRITEAARLRLYAQQFEHQDPRFTADLLAAADRHEYTA